jgi:hypothetical protein
MHRKTQDGSLGLCNECRFKCLGVDEWRKHSELKHEYEWFLEIRIELNNPNCRENPYN